MFMHILMTLNKLNNVHSSVVCSENAYLSQIKLLWASWVQQLRVGAGHFVGLGHVITHLKMWQIVFGKRSEILLKQMPCWTN